MALLKSSLHRWLLVALLLLGAATGAPVRGAPGLPSDYDLKAVFIFHFTRFVEWPATTFKDDGVPFVIGILGEGPFDASLAGVIHGEKVGTHPIEMRSVHNEQEAALCQILYVAAGSEARMAEFKLDQARVLTVGETDLFTRDGGMIRFVTDRNHVRLRIDLAAVRKAGLVISSRLLLVSEIVEGQK